MIDIVVACTVILTLLSLFWKASDPKNYLIKAGFYILSVVGSIWSMALLS